jgi:DNA-directed RNA polymerase specialized sigma24 family protein
MLALAASSHEKGRRLVDEHEKQELYRRLESLLRDLAACDERKAGVACTRLMAKSDPYLRLDLRHLVAYDDLDDVLQTTALKIWSARMGVGKLPVRAWPNFVRKVARNCAYDMGRKRKQADLHFRNALQLLVEQERQEVERFMGTITWDDNTDAFVHYADLLWLGLPITLTAQTLRRLVLAAQLHYLDGEPLAEIGELLPPCPGEPPLTEADLQRWLTDPGIIRALAYRQLFFTPDRLAWHLLGRRGPVDIAELNALSGAACGLGTPLSPEVTIILWRYRFGLRLEEILIRKDCPLNSEQLIPLLASLDERVPFNCVMKRLLDRLTTALGAQRATQILETTGLWQRLAFQYQYVIGPMSLPDICARLQEPAQQVGYDITLSNLNMWLSGKRLARRLARFIVQHQGETSHE